MPIIGLNGLKRSGKDTAYGFIKRYCNEHQIPVRRDAFADRLKWSAARIFWPTISLEAAIEWADNFKENGHVIALEGRGDIITVEVTGRELFQRYGTEAHREIFHEDMWVDALMNDIYPNEPHELIVITDVRFDNEVAAILDEGGEVWEIIRPGTDAGDTHASEQPLERWQVDRTIENNKGLRAFENRVVKALEEALERMDFAHSSR